MEASCAAIDALILSRGGGVFVVGWVDDYKDPVRFVHIKGSKGRWTLDGETLARTRRIDVEDALKTAVSHPYGYYGLLFLSEEILPAGPCTVEVILASGVTYALSFLSRLVEDVDLRTVALSYIATAPQLGNAHIKAIEGLDRGPGAEILEMNRSVVSGLVASPYVERFGRTDAAYDASIIVCLYGKGEFIFLQSSLFSLGGAMDRVEFIYICNSPELSEFLLSEAKACALIYGVDITIILLSGNAGFGAANNLAASYARSQRLMIVNPDVLPLAPGWASQHQALVTSLPERQSKLFGAALYYDDGSLMHGGMHFEVDAGVSAENGRMRSYRLARVEHYGKGSPPESALFVRPRPVPAITGAFMSVDRPWFEALAGFNEDYVFGHYEDADLCLRSLESGFPAWMSALKLWHLEGKGSERSTAHEGGALVNRWLFTTLWGEAILKDLTGSSPHHPLFAEPGLRMSSLAAG